MSMPIPSVWRADTTFSGNVHAPVSPARWRVDGAVTGLIPMWWWGEPGPSTSSTTLLFHIGGLAKVLVPPLLDTPFLIVPRMTDHIAFNCQYPPQHVEHATVQRDSSLRSCPTLWWSCHPFIFILWSQLPNHSSYHIAWFRKDQLLARNWEVCCSWSYQVLVTFCWLRWSDLKALCGLIWSQELSVWRVLVGFWKIEGHLDIGVSKMVLNVIKATELTLRQPGIDSVEIPSVVGEKSSGKRPFKDIETDSIEIGDSHPPPAK